jgi:hypothetical protein
MVYAVNEIIGSAKRSAAILVSFLLNSVTNTITKVAIIIFMK